VSLLHRISHFFLGATGRLGDMPHPRVVKLLGRVVSPNAHESPISGLKSAFGIVEVGERQTVTSDNREDLDWFRPIGGFTFGGELVVESEAGERVLLPANGFSFVSAFVSRTGTALTRGHPLLEPFMTHARPGVLLQVRETTLGHGDKVRVEGTIATEMRVSEAGYRSGQSLVYVGRPPLVVRELAP